MDVPRRSTRLQTAQETPLQHGSVAKDTALAPPISGISPGAQTSFQAPVAHGQPVQSNKSSNIPIRAEPTEPPNTFGTLLVIVYDTDLNSFTKGPYKQGRSEAAGEVKECYTRLINKLRSVGGLRVTARPGIQKGKEGKQVWIFLRAEDQKITELVQREKHEDFLHSVSSTSLAPISSTPHHVTQGDKIRLVHQLLVTSTLQGGLGITPGEGEWKRVTAIIPLQDEKANQEWVQTWLTKKWTVGLQGIDARERDRLAEHFGPSVSMYFSFLSFYTRALIPLSIVGTFFWLGSKGVYARIAELVGLETWARTGGPKELGYGWSWSWVYAAFVSLWAVGFVEAWRVQERKIAVQYGTHKVARVEHLRPQYLASLSDTAGIPAPDSITEQKTLSPSPRDTEFLKREAKMFASVPILGACGTALGAMLTGIFIFEAFFAHLYDGPGKQLLSLIPTLLFVGVVPNIVAILHKLGKILTLWENHPTKRSYENSLTIKTFAINAIVAYLGLFLSAYVYVPFGELIMSYFSNVLTHQQHQVPTTSAEGAGLGPKSDISHRTGIKGDRLVNQLFAYTVTNQAINAFTELGLPYIKQYIEEWRGTHGKTAEDQKRHDEALNHLDDASSSPEEKRLMRKVERELRLPEYSAFGDYAEMVTQFGYIAVWSIIWPLAPVFALINDYVELRSDAVKICNHVQRPVGERVESIGPWLNTMSFISWVAFITNATLTYLFRPSFENSATHQSINPNVRTYSFANYGSNFLHAVLDDPSLASNGTSPDSAQAVLPAWIADSHLVKTILPIALPTLFVGLLASHSYLLVKFAAQWIAEKLLWQGSDEAHGLQHGEEMMKKRYLSARMEELEQSAAEATAAQSQNVDPVRDLGEGIFWRGVQDGNDAVTSALKMA
ncbi:hypothetical protein QFC22_002945 [Naganishia vaughanmartiniae]|uniref:Uncharacterized protein n=1 Tax=Naganishia vaughanmartiniae TaxID=1424756 RepID=A0ACC2X8W4_9TREE|nr:hypothetical protein QFC22_002945 [Naganishia vaughanmartiniae]